MSQNIDINQIWKELDNYNEVNNKQESQDTQNIQNEIKINTIICNNCNSENILENTYEITCDNCGLVLKSDFCVNSQSFVISEPIKKTYSNIKSAKLKKMQDWYMWSNDEKAQYKLSLYTKNICEKLELPEFMYENICQIVQKVMDAIKKQDGTKRARVKDGIILVCIQYVYNHVNDVIHKPTAIELAKKINLDVKYITKAEKIVLELINMIPNILNKTVILDIKKPMDYVNHVNIKYNLQIPNTILTKVEYLIFKCEQKDILLDHTPLSIGVCCLYYILKINNIEIDLKLFSNIYNLSVVTVMKTYNKLKSNQHLFLM